MVEFLGLIFLEEVGCCIDRFPKFVLFFLHLPILSGFDAVVIAERSYDTLKDHEWREGGALPPFFRGLVIVV